MERVEYAKMYARETRHFWFVGTRKVILAALGRALGRQTAPRVLDVGCGTGFTLTQLPPGVTRFGVDASPDALAFARDRAAGATLVRGAIEHLPFRDASFDAVLALDVLEHVDSDVLAAREIFRVLRDGGALVATVPALRSLWGPHDVALHHRRRYRLSEARMMLMRAGFEVETATYFNSILFPFVAAARAWDQVRGAEEATGGGGVPPAPLNALLTKAFELERRWLERHGFPIGVSCLLVARRPARSSG